MRKSLKILSLLLSGMIAAGVSACNKTGGGDVDLDSAGNIRPGPGGETTITFW